MGLRDQCLEYLAVMLGAALGGLARYLDGECDHRSEWRAGFRGVRSRYNVIGCFFIGLISTMLIERFGAPTWALLLVTGILGGYTTFSAFGWETVQTHTTGGASPRAGERSRQCDRRLARGAC